MYAYVGEVNVTMERSTKTVGHWAPTQDSPRKTILELFKPTLTYAKRNVWFIKISSDSSLSDLKVTFYCDHIWKH